MAETAPLEAPSLFVAKGAAAPTRGTDEGTRSALLGPWQASSRQAKHNAGIKTASLLDFFLPSEPAGSDGPARLGSLTSIQSRRPSSPRSGRGDQPTVHSPAERRSPWQLTSFQILSAS